MKPRALLLTIAICFHCNCLLVCQEWIGTQFRLDTAVSLTHPNLPTDLSQLKCEVSDDILYFTDMKAFHDKTKDYAATIFAVNLVSLEQFTLTLPFPSHTPMKEQMARTFWVNDFSIDEHRIVVSAQDQILLYDRNRDGSYSLDTLFYHQRVKCVYTYKNDLYYLEEDHDNGYIWFLRRNLYGNEQEIGRLKYDAPHVVQANPNRYLFHTDSILFFLSTRHPQVQQYSLDGTLLKTVTLDLPLWHAFEDEYIRQSLDSPYGVERINATMGDIFKYSYLKMMYPIGDEYLLLYTQYDTATERSHTQFAIIDSTGKSHLFSRADTSTATYDADRFPFNFLDRYADKARASWRDKLIEICLDSDVNWHGLTPDSFKAQEENFYKKSEPILKIRIQTYKNTPSATRFFFDSEHRLLSLDELPGNKHILLVNQALECSACRNELLNFMNSIDTTTVSIGILYPTIPGVLQEYEIKKSIRARLALPFRLYYLDPDRKGTYPRYTFPPDLSYPAMLFHEKGKAPILFSTDQIFDDNLNIFDFRTEYLEFTNQFFDRLPEKK